MYTEFLKRIIRWLVRENVISEDEIELYEYGLFHLVMNTVAIVSIFIIAVWVKCIVFIICFTATFAALRKYAGGYHASTVFRCYVLTLLVTASSTLFNRCGVMTAPMMVGAWIVAGVIIISFAPVPSRNKPLDEIEYIVYRKRTYRIWMMENVILLFFLFFGLKECQKGVLVGQCCIAVTMLVGKWFIK